MQTANSYLSNRTHIKTAITTTTTIPPNTGLAFAGSREIQM